VSFGALLREIFELAVLDLVGNLLKLRLKILFVAEGVLDI
jgi:hypothetical protein